MDVTEACSSELYQLQDVQQPFTTDCSEWYMSSSR